ncbi:RNA methyltransferase [Robertkochia solimangrovi]|uniref:RNA methyltransferase n=1 Tax=Robertkochia solimangrovi TaxID=2213046 RepID=UPI001180B903|nr:RNA methyltransferase [Robertkochia solimangrovi]TRZ44449.1 TrmH family RNA methyltransferase [Robertkochia solimangrovi]
MRKLKNSELNRIGVEAFKESDKMPLTIILDDIRSLNNIGSVFRSSDAFLVEKIILCGITARPPHKDIQKTALGATESVHWEYAQDCLGVIKRLKEDGVITVAIEQAEGAVMLDAFRPEKGQSYAFVLGNEVKGVSQKVVSACDAVVEIPQFGTKHSLNIAVTTGIVIWDFYNKTKNS